MFVFNLLNVNLKRPNVVAERRILELEANVRDMKQQLATSNSKIEVCDTVKEFDQTGSDCSRGSAADAFVDANAAASSDKVPRNGYHEAYGPMLIPYIHKKAVRILEIGVQNGNSLELWKRLFPDHEVIIGVAYGVGDKTTSDFKTVAGDRTLIYNGDQSDPTSAIPQLDVFI